MTQLEQRLTKQLEIQQRAFTQELQKIASTYEKNMSEAKAVIVKQRETLERYGSISKNWQISINQEQLEELENKSNEREQCFTKQIQSLKQELINVATYTESLEIELRKVLSQLNELHSEL